MLAISFFPLSPLTALKSGLGVTRCTCKSDHAIAIVPQLQAQPWINLANTYTANGDHGLALVALNVTPMAHETDYKMAEMPEPLRLHNNNEVLLVYIWV